MRFAADTLAPQAIVGASRRRVESGTAFAGTTFTAWPTTGLYGCAGSDPCPPMMSLLVNKAHVGTITARRLSEASP